MTAWRGLLLVVLALLSISCDTARTSDQLADAILEGPKGTGRAVAESLLGAREVLRSIERKTQGFRDVPAPAMGAIAFLLGCGDQGGVLQMAEELAKREDLPSRVLGIEAKAVRSQVLSDADLAFLRRIAGGDWTAAEQATTARPDSHGEMSETAAVATRRRAISALGNSRDQGAFPLLMRLASDEGAKGFADAATLAIGRLRRPEAQEMLERALGDPSSTVAAVALRGLAALDTSRGVQLGVARLESDRSREFLDALKQVSGQSFGADSQVWRQWSQSLPKDWKRGVSDVLPSDCAVFRLE